MPGRGQITQFVRDLEGQLLGDVIGRLSGLDHTRTGDGLPFILAGVIPPGARGVPIAIGDGVAGAEDHGAHINKLETHQAVYRLTQHRALP